MFVGSIRLVQCAQESLDKQDSATSRQVEVLSYDYGQVFLSVWVRGDAAFSAYNARGRSLSSQQG